MPDVRIMRRTSVFGVYDHGQYGAVERVSDHLPEPAPHQPRQRYWKIVARRAVLAAGAIERPIAFAGNDRPGVMLAGAVRTYLNRFAATPVAAAGCLHQQRRRLAHGEQMRYVLASRSRRSSIHEPTRRNVRPPSLKRTVRVFARRASCSSARARGCFTQSRSSTRRARHHDRVRWPRRVGWLEPVAASYQPPRRQAAMA